MARDKFDNRDETPDDLALGNLLRKLDRIAEPKDFDFQLKARIANTDPARLTRKTRFPVPVYAVSLAILLIVGSFLLMRDIYTGEPQPLARGERPENPGNSLSNVTGSGLPAADPEVAGAEPLNTGQIKTPSAAATPVNRAPAVDRERPGGSIDSSLGNTGQILGPGFDANAPRRELQTPSDDPQRAIYELMKTLGIEAAFEGDSLKVKSVGGGTVGDRSGVRAADIIESIDDIRLTRSTKLGTRLAAKTLTVVRAGERIQLKIGGR